MNGRCKGQMTPRDKQIEGSQAIGNGVHLEQYVDEDRMCRLLLDLSCEFSTGMGILGVDSQKKQHLLYPIIEKVNFFPFCDAIRTTEKGRIRCQESDWECALGAIDGVCRHPCHTGLTDICVPISIQEHIVAFVYAGQIRTGDIEVNQVKRLRNLYEELGIGSVSPSEGKKPMTFDDFQCAFLHIPRKTDDDIDRITRRLRQIADTISIFAEHSYCLSALQRLAEELVPVRDRDEGLRRVAEVIRQLFLRARARRGDLSFGIWRNSEDVTGKYLECLFAQRHNQMVSGDKLRFRGGCHGVSAKQRSVLCDVAGSNPRPVLLAESPLPRPVSNEYDSDAKTLLCVPVLSEETCIGVISICHTARDAFGHTEIRVASTLANIVASFIRRCDEFQAFTEVAGVSSPDRASEFALRYAPLVTLGEKAMVFFWQGKEGEERLEPVYPDQLESVEGGGRMYYKRAEGLTGWVGHYGLPLIVSNRDPRALQSLFENEQRPALLKLGWADEELEPPVWREITKERIAKPSKDCPVILVPIHRLNRALSKPRPIGVLRVADKTRGFFTRNDQRVLEGIASVISLCHEYQRNQSHFIETAVYQLMTTMGAIHARAQRLSNEVPHERAEDYRQLQALVQYLTDVFRTMAYQSLGTVFARAIRTVELNEFIQDLVDNYLVYAQTIHEKETPTVGDVFTPSGRCVKIVTNKALLHVVLFHLLDNAFKASVSPAGMRVKLQAKASGPIVSIRDDGLGISEKDFHIVSKPFFQGEFQPGLVEAGKGIGLFVCRRALLDDLKGNLVITTKTRNSDVRLIRDFGADRAIRKMRHTGPVASSFTIADVILPWKIRASRMTTGLEKESQ